MTAIMEYPATKTHPAFQLTLRVNFISGDGGKSTTRIFGSEGVIDMGWNGFTIRHSKMPQAPGYGGWDAYETYPESMQKEIASRYDQQYSKEQRTVTQAKDIVYPRRTGTTTAWTISSISLNRYVQANP